MEEVEKLLTAGFIREVYYPEWLANVVMVKKSNGKCCMCMDFTDLNQAYPKESFPLPRIDQLVDSTTGHELLTFMDAFSGYNQIRMSKEDQEKTAFVTSQGLYCYKVMSFGLKNAGATYQRPRIVIKAQALVDFVAEFTTTEQDPESEYWMMNIDGSAASGIGGVGVILFSPEKDILKYWVKLHFLATNNKAEYETILMGLRMAKALGVRNLKLNFDSKLVTGQMNGEYEANEGRMKRYVALTNQLISNFDDVKITQLLREENSEADEVAKLASSETSNR
nr:uncharacterized protein LOC112032298 [Quercus suber]